MFNYPINSFVRNVFFPENLAVRQQDESLKRGERSLTFGVRKGSFSEQGESFRQVDKLVF